MEVVAYNLSHGKFCFANVAIVIGGWIAQATLKEQAQIYAAFATGVWMTVQSVLALINWSKTRKVRRRHPAD